MADIPVEEMYDDKDKPEKPSYVTRAVAARKNAGLDRDQEPRTAQGAEKRADDTDNEVEDDPVNYGSDPAMAQGDRKETAPMESKAEQEVLGKGRRKKIQRVPFCPIMLALTFYKTPYTTVHNVVSDTNQLSRVREVGGTCKNICFFQLSTLEKVLAQNYRYFFVFLLATLDTLLRNKNHR